MSIFALLTNLQAWLLLQQKDIMAQVCKTCLQKGCKIEIYKNSKLVDKKIAIDLSHTNERTFYNIIEVCKELKNKKHHLDVFILPKV